MAVVLQNGQDLGRMFKVHVVQTKVWAYSLISAAASTGLPKSAIHLHFSPAGDLCLVFRVTSTISMTISLRTLNLVECLTHNFFRHSEFSGHPLSSFGHSAERWM
jgi:hypothetical protein